MGQRASWWLPIRLVTMPNRPPLGLVVEGEGEAVSLPGVACRIATGSWHIPRVNARGCGGISGNLFEHLDDLVATFHPHRVLVCVDLREFLRKGMFADCEALRLHLVGRIRAWTVARAQDPRMQPMPSLILPVIQVVQFETWWIGDLDSLRMNAAFEIEEDLAWADVDQEVPSPASWLHDRRKRAIDLKSPGLALQLMSGADITVLRSVSPSFDKFAREVASATDAWLKLVS